jgi:two-component system OmpR family sensor kinase
LLSGRRSLAFRASLIFSSVYAAIFLAAIVISAAVSWADRGEGNYRGEVLARDYAVADLRDDGQRLTILADGDFATLAARNPSTWLVVIREGRTFTWGPISRSTVRTVVNLQPVIDSTLFKVPGSPMPLAAGAMRRLDMPSGAMIVAAGGVDPATLSTAQSLHLLLEPEVAGMLVVIAFLSLLGMIAAARSFSRALAPITVAAAAIGPADPGRRLVESQAPGELLPLVRGFNAALDRLERELGRRKRFITDVAHELRTPLAVVSLQADSLADGGGKADLQRGLARMARLLAQMLDLERLTLAAQPEKDADLVAIARDMVADLAPMAIDQGYDLSLMAPDQPVIVKGDPHAIARAVVNLVGNAIAHGGNRGQIGVKVGATGRSRCATRDPGSRPTCNRACSSHSRAIIRRKRAVGLASISPAKSCARTAAKYVSWTAQRAPRCNYPFPSRGKA